MRLLLFATLLLSACSMAPPAKDRVPVSEDLREVFEQLCEHAPPARPVTVRLEVCDIPEVDMSLGETFDLGLGLWLIRIDKDLCIDLQRIVLTHEWAHVLAGHAGTCDEGDHGPIFGICWAAAWRAVSGGE